MKRVGKLILTAGHHLADSGAVGNGFREADLNIELRDLVYERLKQLRSSLSIWVDDDRDTLGQVIAKVKSFATSNDFWLELHFDSAANQSASGSTALVANNARAMSVKFGEELLLVMPKVMSIPNRGVKDEKASNRGRLGMLHTAASSVLLEIAFISNWKDMESYQKWKYWVAEEIALAIIRVMYDGE